MINIRLGVKPSGLVAAPTHLRSLITGWWLTLGNASAHAGAINWPTSASTGYVRRTDFDKVGINQRVHFQMGRQTLSPSSRMPRHVTNAWRLW